MVVDAVYRPTSACHAVRPAYSVSKVKPSRLVKLLLSRRTAGPTPFFRVNVRSRDTRNPPLLRLAARCLLTISCCTRCRADVPGVSSSPAAATQKCGVRRCECPLVVGMMSELRCAFIDYTSGPASCMLGPSQSHKQTASARIVQSEESLPSQGCNLPGRRVRFA